MSQVCEINSEGRGKRDSCFLIEKISLKRDHFFGLHNHPVVRPHQLGHKLAAQAEKDPRFSFPKSLIEHGPAIGFLCQDVVAM